MKNKLTRSLSRPFSGLTNYLRPHLHSERGISSKQAQEIDQHRRLSGGVTSTTFVEDFADEPSTTDDEFQDQSISFEPITDTSLSSSDADHEPLTFPFFTTNPVQPFQSRQWKECSPVLEDPEGEAAEGSGFFVRRPAQNADDSLVDPDRLLSVFETPEKCRSSPWHACHSLPDHDSPATTEPTAATFPAVEETSSIYSRTPFEPIADTSLSASDSDCEPLGIPFFTTDPAQPFQARQWKACSPVLEDPEGEAAEGSGFLLRRPAQNADDSLVDPDRSLSVFGTPEKCSSSPWHACPSRPEHDSPANIEPSAATSPDVEPVVEETSSVYSRTPSLIGEDDSAFEHQTPRSSEDSQCGPTTPDTSLPLSTVEPHFPWHKGKREATEVEIPSASSSPPARPHLVEVELAPPSTSTPPRPQFVEVVETCPTPPSAPQVRAESRSRSLLKSGLGIDFAAAEEEAGDSEGEGDDTFLSSAHSRYVTSFGSTTDLITEQQPRASTDHGHERSPSDSPSYDSQLCPDAAHFDTYTRRPRSAFSPPLAPDSPEALPFPTLSATDLVSSLLSSHPPHSLRPSSPSSSPLLSHLRPIPPPPQTRPRSPPSSSYSRGGSRSASPSPSPIVPLRAQPSTSTLYSYDLAHLPAPHTPRERPYRVRAWSVLMPTALLGGGRGSGQFGDVWGAVERKGEAGGAAAPAAVATRRRSRSSWGLSGLSGLASVKETDRFEGDHEREESSTVLPLKRGASLRRSLSRWTGLAKADKEKEDVDPKLEEAKHRRRSSLCLSVLGRRERKEERLEQWVSVVVA
ncbi:hypothetical protein JCM1840_006706 [Sporobolomyces johnsonii]